MAVRDFDTDELRRHLSYDPETGEFTWLSRRGGPASAGSRAGTPNGHGYTMLRLNGRSYGAHRVAYAFVYGAQPEMIDHINGNRSDNRIANLRAATQSLNMQNRRTASSRSGTGALGATWEAKDKKYRARIVFDGKRRSLGRFDTIEEASVAYLAAKRLYHAGCTI